MASSIPNTYVYQGKEVILTGRTATREGRNQTYTLHEIKPVDETVIAGNSWVRLDDLFIIEPPTP